MNLSARLALRIGLIGLAAVLAAGVVWRLTTAGEGGDGPKDPDAARIDRLRRNRDVAALAKEAARAKVEVARRAVAAMARVGPQAAPQIRQAMNDPRAEVRESAVVALGRVSARVPLPVDMAALAKTAREDGSLKVRAGAVTALGAIHAFEELETLLSAMQQDESLDVRRRAAAAVIRIIGVDVGFKAGDPPQKRQQAIERIRAVWDKDGPVIRQFYTAVRKKGLRI